MRVMWLGTATLILENADTRILFDPYLMPYAKYKEPIPMDEAKKASAVFVTHPHFDHFMDAPDFRGSEDTPIYVSGNGIANAARNGFSTTDMVPVKPGDEIETGNLRIRVHQGKHVSFDIPNALRVGLSPKTYFHFPRSVKILRTHKSFPITSDIYVYEIQGSEKTVMVCGSCDLDEETSYPHGADLLALAYQGRADLPKQSANVLRRVNPKAVMLTHFDDAYPPITTEKKTDRFLSAVQKNFPGMRAFVPERNTWYEI
ncbi:MAG: MBL fold metallo-hydrolase [Clostridia bacterium]|nr:MBL fold metallo-hydrolase [Clostridia bacterium]